MTTGKTAALGEQRLVYVYGVTGAAGAGGADGAATPAPLRLAGILPETPVMPLVHGNLTAFVSEVPGSRFGADEFRCALNDAQWLKDRILAHEQVLEELRSSCDVVPFRFGTIYLDFSQVANALARHRADLRRALDRIAGACEWGVKLYCDRDRLRRRIEAASAALRRTRGTLAAASPGARFFLQKKYAKAVDGEAATAVADCVQRTHRRLNRCARESGAIAVQLRAVHGRTADMVANAAYLVAEGSVPQFRRTVADLQNKYAAHGFDYELSGPWPPYHFASIPREGVGHAAAGNR